MGGPHVKTRRHSKIDSELPDEIKDQVNRLLIEDSTYPEIADFLKKKGFDISKSSVGRYGKEFLNEYKQLRIIEDQARTLVSESGEGLVLEEAGSKLFGRKIIELLMDQDVDIRKIPKLMMGFASLQRSSVAREKLKSELQDKVKETAEKVTEIVKSKGLSEQAANIIKNKILGIAK